VDRDRPYDVLNELKILIERQPDSSFPSGHAANSLASAIVFFKLFENKKSKFGVLVAGLVMALSRVYVGVHYLSDVLVGIGVGILSGLSVCKFAKRNILLLLTYGNIFSKSCLHVGTHEPPRSSCSDGLY
jgi:undecaprenyl-diphosphatase